MTPAVESKANALHLARGNAVPVLIVRPVRTVQRKVELVRCVNRYGFSGPSIKIPRVETPGIINSVSD